MTKFLECAGIIVIITTVKVGLDIWLFHSDFCNRCKDKPCMGEDGRKSNKEACPINIAAGYPDSVYTLNCSKKNLEGVNLEGVLDFIERAKRREQCEAERFRKWKQDKEDRVKALREEEERKLQLSADISLIKENLEEISEILRRK